MLINSYCFAKRKVFGWLGLEGRPVRGWTTRPNRSSFIIVGLVFVCMAAGATIFTAAIFKQGDYNLELIRSQINNFHPTAVAAVDVALSPAALASDSPDLGTAKSNGPLSVVESPAKPVHGDEDSSTIVLPGEGFWQAAGRLVKKTAQNHCLGLGGTKRSCQRPSHYYDTLTADLLIENGVMKKNSELRIAQPGARLTLDSSDNLFVDGVLARDSQFSR